MSLYQSLSQIRTNVRRYTDTAGSTALLRHPDADLNDYINQGLGSLHRKLTEALPDQRFLATSSFDLSEGTSLYALPSNFDHLISVDLTASGIKRWLESYEMPERPALTSPDSSFQGIPFAYRLRSGNIEFLPTPGSDEYEATIWFVPDATQLATDSDVFDTISRLDAYVVAYASRLVATRDKSWDLVGECRATMQELEAEIRAIARGRDKNSPARITDEMQADRYGRRRRYR